MSCEPLAAQQLPAEQSIFNECWRLLRALSRGEDGRDEADYRKGLILSYGDGPAWNLSSALCSAILLMGGDGLDADTVKTAEDILVRCWGLVKSYAAISMADNEAWDRLLEESSALYAEFEGTAAEPVAQAAAMCVVNYCEARSLLAAGADLEELSGKEGSEDG